MRTITFRVSEYVREKAFDLLADGRVHLIMPTRDGLPPGAQVEGETGIYQTWFLERGVMCTCRAGADHGATEPRCSHAVAAMILWGDVWHIAGSVIEDVYSERVSA